MRIIKRLRVEYAKWIASRKFRALQMDILDKMLYISDHHRRTGGCTYGTGWSEYRDGDFEVQHSGAYERPHPFEHYIHLSICHQVVADYTWLWPAHKWKVTRFNIGLWQSEFDAWYECTKVEARQDKKDRFASYPADGE